MSDIRQSLEFSKYLEKLDWQTYEYKVHSAKCIVYVRKIPILGNFVKIHHPSIELTNNDLKEIAKKYKAFSVQITFSPSKTLVLDLKPSLEKIFENFSKDTRYEIRKSVARKRNPSEVPSDGTKGDKIEVKLSDDISSFAKMWTETALRRHFWIPFEKEIKSLYESFGPKAYLFMSFSSPSAPPDFACERTRWRAGLHPTPSVFSHQPSVIGLQSSVFNPSPSALRSSPLAGALVLINGKVAHYFHAASTLEGRRLQAPSLVIWEAIQLAKEKGCTAFDFEGIFDPRDKDTKNWQGFTRFKKGFGGKEVEYPLTKTKFYFFNFF